MPSSTPHRIAVDDRGVVLSYRDLDDRASALATRLDAAGYGVGDRIATITGNSADHVVLFFACAKAGLVLVPSPGVCPPGSWRSSSSRRTRLCFSWKTSSRRSRRRRCGVWRGRRHPRCWA
ncbi:AMP-binding protein [Humibacter ginsenosidimutans]|uniref:AMP-binding protein n=1 Tax=Humibacter ginsenosidimutans TaxID=2599293 RepID=UPI001FEE9A4C|nr:AMP-binding protein [Humibacter ginsenosidimutans]